MDSQVRIGNDNTLSVGQATRVAGVSAEAVRQWIRAGRLPCQPTPLGALVSPYDLDELIAAREAAQRRRRHNEVNR